MPRPAIANVDPICIECGALAKQGTGAQVWPDRRDLADRVMWICECGAYVGSHPNTEIPLGYPAGEAVRRLRMRAHDAYDALWKAKVETAKISKGKARALAYTWLAGELQIAPHLCHISMFGAEDCRRVIALCKPIAERLQRAKMAASGIRL